MTLVDYTLGEHTFETPKRPFRSKNYSPPESLLGVEDEGLSAWQAGVIAFLLLTGRFPYSGETKDQVRRKITQRRFNFPSSKKLSPVARDFLMRILHREKKKRLTAPAALKHPYLNRKLEEEQWEVQPEGTPREEDAGLVEEEDALLGSLEVRDSWDVKKNEAALLMGSTEGMATIAQSDSLVPM